MSKVPLLSLFLLTGCLFQDPTRNGDVAPCPSYIINPEARVAPCLEYPEIDEEKEYKLGELVDFALQNNPNTREAWDVAKSQAFNYYASQSLYLPTVTLDEVEIFDQFSLKSKVPTTSTMTTGVFSGNTFGYSQYLETSLTVQYLLFDFGTRSGTVDAAKYALIAADWNHHYTIQQVILNACISYYNYLEAKALVVANEKNLENSRVALEAAQAGFEAGVKSKVDYLQAKANYYNTELDLQNSIAAEKIAMGQLSNALGLPADVVLKVEDVPYTIQPKPIEEGIEDLIEAAREQRADLAAQEALVYQNLSALKAAWGNFLPTVTADVNYFRNDYQRGTLKWTRDLQALVVLDIPLFEGFRNYNQIRQAQANYDAAYAAWEVLESNVLVTVLAAYYQYVTSNDNLTTTDEYLQYATESFEAVLEEYKAGVQTIVDLLTAELALANARERQITARAEWLKSIVNIAFTTGLLGIDSAELSIAIPEMKDGEIQ